MSCRFGFWVIWKAVFKVKIDFLKTKTSECSILIFYVELRELASIFDFSNFQEHSLPFLDRFV